MVSGSGVGSGELGSAGDVPDEVGSALEPLGGRVVSDEDSELMLPDESVAESVALPESSAAAVRERCQ